jgi:hypothetical protein
MYLTTTSLQRRLSIVHVSRCATRVQLYTYTTRTRTRTTRTKVFYQLYLRRYSIFVHECYVVYIDRYILRKYNATKVRKYIESTKVHCYIVHTVVHIYNVLSYIFEGTTTSVRTKINLFEQCSCGSSPDGRSQHLLKRILYFCLCATI